jgi:heme-degrading monooxygenase HmoA
MSWSYVIIWEFYVRPGMEERFEQVYGPWGDWARLFHEGEGYIATELNRDLKNKKRYVTLDFWTSAEAYEGFRKKYLAEYKAMDEKCGELTEREVELGTFIRIGERSSGSI